MVGMGAAYPAISLAIVRHLGWQPIFPNLHHRKTNTGSENSALQARTKIEGTERVINLNASAKAAFHRSEDKNVIGTPILRVLDQVLAKSIECDALLANKDTGRFNDDVQHPEIRGVWIAPWVADAYLGLG